MSIAALIKRSADVYFRMQINQRLYINALGLLPLALLASLIPVQGIPQAFWLAFFAYWLTATGSDLLGFYTKVYDTLLGKTGLLLLLTVCTNFAVVLSSQIVNDLVAIDPSKFPHTVALLSILTIPLFVVIGLGGLYLLLLAGSSVLLMFHLLPDDRLKQVVFPGYAPPKNLHFPKTTRLVQFLSMAVFCGFVFGLSGKAYPGYEDFLSRTASSFIFHWEMYSKSPCFPEPQARVAFLGDEKVLVGTRLGEKFSFAVRECKHGGA